MERKFERREAAGFGGGSKPPITPNKYPGLGGLPGAPGVGGPSVVPDIAPTHPPNSAPNGPAPQGQAPPPKDPSQALTEQNKGISEQPGMPRQAPPAGAGGSGAPTDVHIDMATGNITIKKGPVNLTFSKYDPNNPPDKVKDLSPKQQKQWVHVYNSAADQGDDEETAHKKAWGAVKKEGAGEWPPQGYDTGWAPEEYGATAPGSIDPGRDNSQVDQFNQPQHITEVDNSPQQHQMEQQMEEMPPQGSFTPGESVKTRDPDTGQDQYGFVVEQNQDGTYRVNYEDGSSKDLHEGWIIPAPEAPNTPVQQQPLVADLRSAFFPKEATHQAWKDFKANDNEPQYGDWADGNKYSEDTHDNPFSAPKNRMQPPTFTVKATVPEHMNARSIAYSLETDLNKNVDVSGNTVTINDVEMPLGLITELNEYGIDAQTTEDLTKFDQGFDDLYKLGQKVAIVGDFPDANYYYDSSVPAAQAQVIGVDGDKYVLRNDAWGTFKADSWEIANV